MTIKEIEKKINELTKMQLKTTSLTTRKNINSEILELSREKDKINQNYVKIIQDNIYSLESDELFDIMINNDIDEKAAKDKLLNIILDRNYDDLENYYNTLLFLQENKINGDNIDAFNININTLLFARNTLEYVDEVNNRETNDVEIKKINDKIEGLKETINNTTNASNLFDEIIIRIGSLKDELNFYNNDLDMEINDINNKKYNLYNTIDFYENRATGVKALQSPFKIKSAKKELIKLEKLLEIKLKEQKQQQTKLNKNTILVWNTISNEEKEIFSKANYSYEDILSSIKFYIKNKVKDGIIDVMAGTIKRAKTEYQLLTIKKKSLEKSTRLNNINLLMDTKNVKKNQNKTIDNIYSKYSFLEKLSNEELSNICEAKITSVTILATPKNKIKCK